MSDTRNYKCPACTGPLHFAGASGLLECDFCGSKYTVEQMEELAKKVSDDVQKNKEESDKKAENQESENQNINTDGYKTLTCSSCGAELFCDGTTVATSCPYCGNPTIIPSKFTKNRLPDLIIPFKVENNQAIEALKAFGKGRKLLPKSFRDKNHIEEIKGVYVPFWLFSGKSKFDAIFDCEDEESYTRGDERITITKYYKEIRSGEVTFRNVPVDASVKMDNAYMDSLEPYDYQDMKPYSSSYLPGFLAESYDDEEDTCKIRAEKRIKETAQEMAEEDISDHDDVSADKFDCDMVEKDVKYAFFPVWMLSTKWQDKNFLFAMNGQTGKIAGKLPVDKVKRFFFGLRLFIIFEIILNAIWYYFF